MEKNTISKVKDCNICKNKGFVCLVNSKDNSTYMFKCTCYYGHMDNRKMKYWSGDKIQIVNGVKYYYKPSF